MGVSKTMNLPPEVMLADRFLNRIPRIGKISGAALGSVINWDDPNEAELYDLYTGLALDLLKAEKYIEETISDIKGKPIEYSLTATGRTVKDEGGYIKSYRDNKLRENINRRANISEGKKKIFDNKIKYISFLVIVLTTFFGIWSKFSSDSKKHVEEMQKERKGDSSPQQVPDDIRDNARQKITDKKNSTKDPVRQIPRESQHQTALSLSEKKSDNQPLTTLSKTNEPIEAITSDNIEFKLVRAIGNIKTQSITFTMVLTTSAANWYIMSSVRSIIDMEGNEYKLSSFTIGASNYVRSVDLITGVPIKCTYTFKGVLPDVKTIKLFKYDYTHAWGEPFSVEFRDVPISWK